jgi:tetratricopeptide (TPR) repeat protein
LVCLAAGTVKTWKYVQREQGDLTTRRSDRAALVLGASIALLALAFHSVVDFNLHIPANAILATVLAANLTSHLRFATSRHWVTPHWPGRLLVTAVGLAAIIYLGPQAVRRFEEERWLTRAGLARTAADQFEAWQQAHLVEPANAETVQNIGEIYRLVSWEGGDNWREMAETALKWFELGTKLNRWETYNFIRHGMCLDWLGEHAKAQEFFDRAVQLDPNSYYTALMRGWHDIQASAYSSAKQELERSIKILPWNNLLAYRYLDIANQRLASQLPPKPR